MSITPPAPSLVTSIAIPPSSNSEDSIDQKQSTADLSGVFTAAEIGFLEEILIYVEQDTAVARYSEEQLSLLESCKNKLGAVQSQ